MQQIIINIGCCERPKQTGLVMGFKFGLPTQKKRTHMPIVVSITNEQKIKATINPVTLGGKPAAIDPNNPPKWSVVSGDSTVVPSADGKSADLISSDTPGDTTYLVEADADLGEGEEKIQDTITLTVLGARAANLGLTLGTPENKE